MTDNYVSESMSGVCDALMAVGIQLLPQADGQLAYAWYDPAGNKGAWGMLQAVENTPAWPLVAAEVLDGQAHNATVEKEDTLTLVLASRDGQRFRALGGFGNQQLFGRIEAEGGSVPCTDGESVVDKAHTETDNTETEAHTAAEPRCFSFDGTLYLGEDGSDFAAGTLAPLHLSVRLSPSEASGTYQIAPIGEQYPQVQQGTFTLPNRWAEPEASGELAWSLYQAGEHDEAFALLAQLIAAYPDNAALVYGRAQWRTWLKHENAAIIADLRRVTELTPEAFADAWGNLGWYLILQGDFADAQQACEKAQALDPESYALTVNLGHTFLLQGDRDTAHQWYERTIPLIPDENALQTGPLADFDLFIERGWQAEAARAERAWLESTAMAAIPGNQRIAEAHALADRFYQEGDAFMNSGEYLKAAKAFEKSAETERASGQMRLHDFISALANAGAMYQLAGQNGEPLIYQALEIARKTKPKDPIAVAIGLENLASYLAMAGRPNEAESHLREALEIRRNEQPIGHSDIAATTELLAFLLIATGRVDEAAALHESLTEESTDSQQTLLGSALDLAERQGQVYYQLIDDEEIKDVYSEFFRLLKEQLPANDPLVQTLEKVVEHNLSAIAFFQAGDYDSAEKEYRKILGVLQDSGVPYEHPIFAQTNQMLAKVIYHAGRFGKAEAFLRETLAKAQEIYPDGNIMVALGHHDLATILTTTAQYEEAETHFRKALEIFSQAGVAADRPEVAGTRRNLAGLLSDTGRYAEAESTLREALAIQQTTLPPDHREIADSLAMLAKILLTTGRYDEAERYLREALTIYQAKNTTEIFMLNTILARLLIETGRENEAESLLRDSLKIARDNFDSNHPGNASTLNILGVLMQGKGDNEEAEDLYREALEIARATLHSNHPLVANTLINLSALLRETGRDSEAKALSDEALAIAQAGRHPELLWSVQYTLAEIHATAGQRALAIFFGKQAINTLQSVRQNLATAEQTTQQAFLQSKEVFYKQLADWLIAEGRLPEAQRVLRMLKEQEFYDFIRRDAEDDPRQTTIGLSPFEQQQQARLVAPGDLLAALGMELRDLQRLKAPTDAELARINELYDAIDQARADFDEALSAIIAAFEAEAEALAIARANRKSELDQGIRLAEQEKVALLEELEQISGQRVALVQYLMLPEKLHILLTVGETIQAIEVPIGEEALNQAIHAFRDENSGPLLNDRLDPRPQAQALYQSLIAPITAELEAAKIDLLMVYLDGTLRYLPLAALHDGERYLIERYALAVYTAVQDNLLDHRPQDTWQVAAMGVSAAHEKVMVGDVDVDQFYRSFGELPNVPAELEGIVRRSEDDPDDRGVLPGRIDLDAAFTSETFKNVLRNTPAYSVLHLATHFALEDGEDNSFLLLGDGKPLTLRELRRQRFRNIDLVTLSACETAVSLRAQAGREVDGLANVIQDKGAKGVIATLWPVADASTGLFMQQMYRLRREQNLSKAEALRQTQLAFLRGNPQAATDDAQTAEAVRAPVALTEEADSDPAPSFTPDPQRRYAHPYFWAPFILMGNWL